ESLDLGVTVRVDRAVVGSGNALIHRGGLQVPGQRDRAVDLHQVLIRIATFAADRNTALDLVAQVLGRIDLYALVRFRRRHAGPRCEQADRVADVPAAGDVDAARESGDEDDVGAAVVLGRDAVVRRERHDVIDLAELVRVD